jgi:hypothetical protein
MPTLSHHTRLVNLLITLALKTPDLKSPLSDLGYSLEHIGPKIVFSDNTVLTPDISFMSREKNSVLVCEAKAGGIDNDQAKKYKLLKPEDISRRALTALPAENLKVEVCYFCLLENRLEVLANEGKNRWGFPIIFFDGRSLKKDVSSGRFQDQRLEELFSRGVTIEREPPNTFYPFGSGDSQGWIAFCILYELMKLWALNKREITEDELIRSCHPLLGYCFRDERNFVKKITHVALESISKSGSLRYVIKPLGNQRWQLVKMTLGKNSERFITFLADGLDKRPDERQIDDLMKWAVEQDKKEPDD